MRVVVTGASGNVGSALVRRLLEDGHEVVGVVRRPPDLPAMEWVTADLSRDCHDVLVRAVRGADVVVHLVWGFQPTHRPSYLEAVGVGGTRRVLAAVEAAGVPHLVHQSSIGAYARRVDAAPVGEDWPTRGIPTSAYSRHKATAERLLDAFEGRTDTLVTRTRPGIVGQRSAGSAQLRYFLPTVVPSALLRHLPLLPLDGRLTLQVVHAEDVADAIALALSARVGGAFNLVAEPVLDVPAIADVLGARHVPVPAPLLRGVVDVSWWTHLQPVDAGWLDMAYSVPVLDATRARTELGWSPRHDARSVLTEMVDGLASRAHAPTPVLRRRTIADGLARALRRGPVSHRSRP